MGSEGINKEGGLIDVGVEFGVISKSGAFLRYGEQLLGQGKQAAGILLKEQPKLAEKIRAEIMQAAKSDASQKKVVVGQEEAAGSDTE